MSLLKTIRKEVLDLTAYHLEPRSAPVKLDQNENAYGVPAPLRAALAALATDVDWSRYPAFQATELQSALGRLNDWPAEGILVGNGSNELIQALGLATLERGRKVVLPAPSFAVYGQVARVLGAEVVEVPLGPDLAYDPDALCRAVEQHRPALAFLCSPNNPTGSVLSPGDVERVLERSTGIVAVDEAYIDFSASAARELLPRYPQLVLLRTFSKALALAGLRIGYALSHPALAGELRKVQLPYNLNGFSRAAGLAVCARYGLLRAQAEEIAREREWVYRRLLELDGIRPYPSGANFILFESARGARPVWEGLLQWGVLVRDVSSHPRLTRALRVTIGRREENRRLLSALGEVLASLAREKRGE